MTVQVWQSNITGEKIYTVCEIESPYYTYIGTEDWPDPPEPGTGGTTNYNQLTNKPQIGGVMLSGNKTAAELNLVGQATVGNLTDLTTTIKTAIVAAINELDGELGDLSTLTTTIKTSIVNAINEHDTEIGDLSTLTTAAKAALVLAINELDSEIGVLSTLTTTQKSTLVAAINELDGEIGNLTSLTTTHKSTIVGAINEHDTEIGNIANLTTTAKNNLVGAVNELDSDIGDKSTLKTSAKTNVVAAVNELHDNVLEKDNTVAFTPDADYEPATKKYVDDGDAAIETEIAAVANAGAKNLLLIPSGKPRPSNASTPEVSVTDIADGAFTFQTIATTTGARYVEITDFIALQAGKYKFSVGTALPSNVTASLLNTSSVAVCTIATGQSEVEFTLTSGASVRALINIATGVTVASTRIYPMLRDAAIKDDTYQPYAMSNLELTKNTVKNGSGVTPSFADTAFIGHESNGDMMTIRGLNSNTNGMALNFYATNKILRALNRTEQGTWQEYGNISLEDTGWITITSDIQDIVYRKKNGILYLRTAGNVKQAFPNVTPTIATLPTGYRPNVNQFFLYATRLASGNYGYKVSNYGFIETSGAIRLHVENVADIAVNDQIMINATIPL